MLHKHGILLLHIPPLRLFSWPPREELEQTVPLVETAPINAYVAAKGRGGRSWGTGRGVGPSNRGGSMNQWGFAPRNDNNNQRGFGPTRERCAPTSGRITCQICGRQGHPALDCYQRMNSAYKGRIPAKCLNAMASSPITLNRQQNGQWLLDIGANSGEATWGRGVAASTPLVGNEAQERVPAPPLAGNEANFFATAALQVAKLLRRREGSSPPLTENMPINHGLLPHRPSGFAGLQLTIAATATVLHSCAGKGKFLFFFFFFFLKNPKWNDVVSVMEK